jgi:hypothetical protein
MPGLYLKLGNGRFLKHFSLIHYSLIMIISFGSIQGKGNPSLGLINLTPRHEDGRGSGGEAPPFFTAALAGDEWSASRPCRLTSGEIPAGTHWMEGWVVPRAGLDVVEKRITSCPCPKSNPDSLVFQPIAYSQYRLTYIV